MRAQRRRSSISVSALGLAPGRHQRVLAVTLHGLYELRRTDQCGALSGDVAKAWARHLGPIERHFLLAVAAQAAACNDLRTLSEIVVKTAAGSDRPLGGSVGLRELSER